MMPSEDIEIIAESATPDYAAEEERAAVRNAVATLQPPAHRQVVEAYCHERYPF